MKIRKHIFFSGKVQAVGFRYRSYHIAQSLQLTGWVRNCEDGRVEMEVQGTEKTIQELIDRLKEQRFIEIDDIEMWELPIVNDHSFEIEN